MVCVALVKNPEGPSWPALDPIPRYASLTLFLPVEEFHSLRLVFHTLPALGHFLIKESKAMRTVVNPDGS